MSSNIQNDIKIMPKTIVCEESNLCGDITIHPGCVIHPSAQIIAASGPIILGENCIVEEYATITNRMEYDKEAQETPPVMTIGANNVFEVGCKVEACSIGDKNVFECKSYVGPKVTVSSGCIIGAAVHLESAQKLPENTVIYSRDYMQREAIEKHGTQTLQIDFLRKVLPNYHHYRRPNYDPKKTRNAV